MAAATTISCYNPSSKFTAISSFKQRCLKQTSFSNSFSTSTSIFWRGFVLRRNGLRVPKTTDDSITTSAFIESNSDEGEAFIDGSSEFRSKFVFHGVESTLNGLIKWLFSSIFSGFILWRHDAESLWFAAGSVLNAMLSLELKQILNQERPSTLKSDPGMPSSHAQSVFFVVMFAIISSVKWIGMNELTITISGLALAFGSYCSYLRVSQQLHTTSQVVAGAAIGSLFYFWWHWLWNAFVLNAIGSSSWVRIIVVLGSAGIYSGFTLSSILQWLTEK